MMVKESKMINLEDFEIPNTRKDLNNISNIRWLIRNLGVKNKDHPKFEQAIKELIERIK